ncbi:beta strand repeat-containing protein [Methylothermus subterraneus]
MKLTPVVTSSFVMVETLTASTAMAVASKKQAVNLWRKSMNTYNFSLDAVQTDCQTLTPPDGESTWFYKKIALANSWRNSLFFRMLACLGILLLTAAVSWAASDLEFGLSGKNGDDGTFPSGNGTRGDNGSSATAMAISGDNTNFASAQGGNGGDGGTGASGDPIFSPRGGDGGQGGNGGDAQATAETTVSSGIARSEVEAYGGNGGAGGGFGAGTPAGTPGNGGDAGDASARASATTSGLDNTIITLKAVGGMGGTTGGFTASMGGGGSATGITEANTVGPVSVNVQVTGGDGGNPFSILGSLNGGSGGGAQATGSHTSSSGPVTATYAVTGGAGIRGNASRGGSGGSASLDEASRAETSLTLRGTVSGGSGGFGGATGGSGGNASIKTNSSGRNADIGFVATGGSGGSSGGALATGGAGGGASLSASNSALGQLLGYYGAIGGRGGNGATGGGGGNASVFLNLSGNPVFTNSSAKGGRGGDAFNDGGAGGNASFALNASSTGNVAIDGGAQGGEGGAGASGGPGGAASLSVRGTSSGGGIVTVGGSASGGKGGDTAAGVGGTGGSVSLSDAVQGDTTGFGFLALGQGAWGGNGGNVLVTSSVGFGGNGGNAYSALTKAVNILNPFDLSSAAVGGRGGDGPTPGDGGAAEAHAEGVNNGGIARIYALATGGNGGDNQRFTPTFGRGGDARSFATSTTASNFTTARAEAHAYGGAGDVGGSAFTQAIGRAEGNSIVSVTADSWGGLSAKSGGSATAYAQGTSLATENVIVTALATGGGPGAGASANALGSGLGNVESTAQAFAGSGGGATAHAKATGAFGNATAISSGVNAYAVARSPVASTVEVETRTAVGAAPSSSLGAGLQAFSFVTIQPDNASMLRALARNPEVHSNFDVGGTSTLLGLAALGAAYPTDGAGSKTFVSEFIQSIDLSSLSDLQYLKIGFVNPTFTGTFDNLRLLITENGTQMVNVNFTDALAASAFLNDQILNLGSLMGMSGILTLDFEFDFTTTSNGSSFATELLFGNTAPGSGPSPVPLPGSFFLFLAGLGGLILRYCLTEIKRSRLN